MMNFWSTSKVAHAALSTTSSSVTVSQYEIETLYYETRLFVRHTPTESRPRASTPPAGAGMPLWLL